MVEQGALFEDDHGRTFHLFMTPVRHIKYLLATTWTTFACSQICHQKGLTDLRTIDLCVTKDLSSLRKEEKGLVLHQQIGSFYREDYRKHCAGITNCPRCGLPNSRCIGWKSVSIQNICVHSSLVWCVLGEHYRSMWSILVFSLNLTPFGFGSLVWIGSPGLSSLEALARKQCWSIGMVGVFFPRWTILAQGLLPGSFTPFCVRSLHFDCKGVVDAGNRILNDLRNGLTPVLPSENTTKGLRVLFCRMSLWGGFVATLTGANAQVETKLMRGSITGLIRLRVLLCIGVLGTANCIGSPSGNSEVIGCLLIRCCLFMVGSARISPVRRPAWKLVFLLWYHVGSVLGLHKLVGLSAYIPVTSVMWVLRTSCSCGLLRFRFFLPVFVARVTTRLGWNCFGPFCIQRPSCHLLPLRGPGVRWMRTRICYLLFPLFVSFFVPGSVAWMLWCAVDLNYRLGLWSLAPILFPILVVGLLVPVLAASCLWLRVLRTGLLFSFLRHLVSMICASPYLISFLCWLLGP